MLAPQFTLRRLLGAVTASAVVCFAIGFAARGYLWAVAVAIALLGLALMLGLYAVVFLVMQLLTSLYKHKHSSRQ